MLYHTEKATGMSDLLDLITDAINNRAPQDSIGFPTIDISDDMSLIPEDQWNSPRINAVATTEAMATTFQTKPAISWTTDDICEWMHFSAVEGCDESSGTDGGGGWDIRRMSGEKWQDVDGRKLCSMSVSEFIERDQIHGQLLYDLLQRRSIHEPYGQDDNDMLCIRDFELEDLFGSGLPSISVFITPPESASIQYSLADDQRSAYHDHLDSSNIFSDFSVENSSGCLTAIEFSGYHLIETEPNDTPSPTLQSNTNCFEERFHLTTSNVTSTSGIATSAKCRRNTKQQRSATTKKARPTMSSRVTDAGNLNRRRMSSDSCNYASDDGCSGSEGSTGVDSIRITKIIRRKTKKRAVHLWQFMLSLLEDERYNPGCVKWLNTSEGVFRIVNSAEIARLWGIRKNNCSMTFEKMSRSLRWSRDNGFLSDVPKNSGYPKKLCFRFGELAENWFNSPSAINGCLTN